MQEVAKSTAKLTVSPVRYADKLSPGKRLAEKVNLVSNVWGVLPQKNVPIYRYDVRIIEEFPPKKSSKKTAEKKAEVPFKEVTKNSREDYVSIERKNKCVAIFVRVVNREKAFFGKMDGLVYDRASILYSLDVLDVKADESDSCKMFFISNEVFYVELKNSQSNNVFFTVKTFEILPSELPKDVVNPECTRVLFNVTFEHLFWSPSLESIHIVPEFDCFMIVIIISVITDAVCENSKQF
ncbi:unnamed protein product [Anisakis simplex]|uniref:DUF223 domain-containing protein n=1 Tax=Anisakis simplex TaxID=6269 RepID=A0A0M3J018_ANISI|nr:unnamed protein product [Anisakis simplex]